MSKERVERLVKIYLANQITFRDSALQKKLEKISKHRLEGLYIEHLLDINIIVQFMYSAYSRHLYDIIYVRILNIMPSGRGREREKKRTRSRGLGKKVKKDTDTEDEI